MSGSGAPVPQGERVGGAAERLSAARGDAQPLRGRVIGVYGSAGAPWHHLGLAASFGAEVRPVRAEDIRAGRLGELDAFVVPGGGAIAMAGLLAPLGEAGALAIRRWVEEGGTYVSSCAGSVLPLALEDEAARVLPIASCMRMTDVAMANPGDATLGGLSSPGVGRIRVRVDGSHPFARDLPEIVDLVHYNGPLFDVSGTGNAVTPFAWPVEPTGEFTPAERFLAPGASAAAPSGPAPGGSAATEAPATASDAPEAPTGAPDASEAAAAGDDALVVTRCIRMGAATGLETRFGRGRVVLFGSHPEFGLGPLALGWGDGARLLVRALARPDAASAAVERAARLPASDGSPARAGASTPEAVGAGAARAAAGPSGAGEVGSDGNDASRANVEAGWTARPERPGDAASELAARAAEEMTRAATRFAELAMRDPGAWLDASRAPSLGGRSARSAWRVDGAYASAALRAAAQDLAALAPDLTDAQRPWLDDAARDDQDFGWMGLTQLLERIHAMLDGAERTVREPPQQPAHAYDLFDSHPFHLAVGTYLSAAGLAAGALLTTVVTARAVGAATPEIDLALWVPRGREVAA